MIKRNDYKKGEKVRFVKNITDIKARDELIGNVYTIKGQNEYGLWDIGANYKASYLEIEPVVENKIVITTNGKKTLARLYENGKVIKSAEAACNPEDEYDFNVGAKLAYKRLMLFAEPQFGYTGKLFCTTSDNTNYWTVGKCYTSVKGAVLDNDGDRREITVMNGNRVYMNDACFEKVVD